MLVDKSGRKLKRGCYVDINTNGMLTGVVTEIHESVIDLPGSQGKIPPRVVIQLLPMQIPVTMRSQNGDGMVPEIYIVADAPPETKQTVDDVINDKSADKSKSGLTLVS